MKLPKYNLGYNTRDQLRSLAINASERESFLTFIILLTVTFTYFAVIYCKLL